MTFTQKHTIRTVISTGLAIILACITSMSVKTYATNMDANDNAISKYIIVVDRRNIDYTDNKEKLQIITETQDSKTYANPKTDANYSYEKAYDTNNTCEYSREVNNEELERFEKTLAVTPTPTPIQNDIPQTESDSIATEETNPIPHADTEPITDYNTAAELLKQRGRIDGPSGEETYYNKDMTRIVQSMHDMGFTETDGYNYWIRDDGAKMLGQYVMVAANLELRPKGTIVQSSLGPAIVCDTGGFAKNNPTMLDIAVNW